MRVLQFIVALVAFAVPAPAWSAQGRDRTVVYDVVHLVRTGESIDGKPEFAASAGRFSYTFATAENLAAFNADVARFEIQLGGACARMGPLSGEGTPRLKAVHDGKLYIFASEQCRATFVAAPQKFIDTDDPPPAFTEETRARGRAMLGRAVDSIACLAQIDAVTTYRQVLARDVESGGKKYHVTKTLTLNLPDAVRSDECWNESCFASVADSSGAGGGWSVSGGGGGGGDTVEPMHDSQRAVLLRTAGHNVFAILRARDAASMIATSAGEIRKITVPGEGELEIELVTVHRAGATTTLGLDASGRVRLLSFRGRGPDSTIGQIEQVFSEFHVVSGLRLPKRIDVTFDGKPVPDQSGEFLEQEIDDPVDLARFKRPAPGS